MALNKRVQGVYEAAALDPEKMVAPKDVWFDEKGLERWYESRNGVGNKQDNYGTF